jgi:hypothetical protein
MRFIDEYHFWLNKKIEREYRKEQRREKRHARKLDRKKLKVITKLLFYHRVCMLRNGKLADFEQNLIAKLLEYEKQAVEIPHFIAASSFIV